MKGCGPVQVGPGDGAAQVCGYMENLPPAHVTHPHRAPGQRDQWVAVKTILLGMFFSYY